RSPGRGRAHSSWSPQRCSKERRKPKSTPRRHGLHHRTAGREGPNGVIRSETARAWTGALELVATAMLEGAEEAEVHAEAAWAASQDRRKGGTQWCHPI